MRRVFATIAALLAATPVGAMTIASPGLGPAGAFAAAQYHTSCGGQDLAPRLSWSGAPPGARSLVLTMIDQDVAPSKWSHWIVVDLPASSSGLPGGARAAPHPARGVTTNMGQALYEGPCPPHGSGVHHYRMTIWAMPTAHTGIAPGQRADAVEAQLRKASLASASVTGTAQR
jgi:Raf kinase inhibitor-like YbhB/YbcL family protein